MRNASSFLVAATAALLLTTAASAETFPHTVKYPDSSLETRTLLNQDGSADVELSATRQGTRQQINQ